MVMSSFTQINNTFKLCTSCRDKEVKSDSAKVKILVGCKVESYKDNRREFAMRISQPKDLDMFLSAEDEIQFIEWLTRLQMATKPPDGWEDCEGSTSLNGADSRESSPPDSRRMSLASIDFTKRMLPRPPTTAAGARESQVLIPTDDNPSDNEYLNSLNGEGIYDLPRSSIAPYGGKIIIGSELYDRPRSYYRDDEGVYFSPNSEDDKDEDIYVYPPDAIDDHTMLTLEQALLSDYDYPKLPRGSMVSSSASTYRDSAMSDSTIRNSSASYVTIRESEGQSMPGVPPRHSGYSTNSSGTTNGEVKFSPSELSQLMDTSSRASLAISEGLYDRPKSLWSTSDEGMMEIEQMESVTGGIKGYLYRKERFQWTKMMCCLKNNRFECYKGNTIVLKLFLPGAEVTPDVDSKRAYSFKIKHPRKEVMLHFAAETEMQFGMWLSAFIKAANISVQSVKDVDQIRIVDAAMKEKWNTLQKVSSDEKIKHLNDQDSKKKLVKASTYSVLDVDGVGSRDGTLQRKKKLTDRLTRGMFSGKKKKKISLDNSSKLEAQHILPTSPKPSQSNDDLLAMVAMEKSTAEKSSGPMKRSASLDTVLSVTRSPIASPKHAGILQPKTTAAAVRKAPMSNAGFLLVQQDRMQGDDAWIRYWSVLDNMTINFYPEVMDVGSHFTVCLCGSRVSRATQETQRPFTFKIWHLESGNRVYCVAEGDREYVTWFDVLINGAEHIVPSGPSSLRRSGSFYYFPDDTKKSDHQPPPKSDSPVLCSSNRLVSQSSLGSSQENLIHGGAEYPVFGSNGSLSSLGSTDGKEQLSGVLRHRMGVAGGNWEERYCTIKRTVFCMYAQQGDKTPLAVLVLPKCRCSRVVDETERHVFCVIEDGAKTQHCFAVSTKGELAQWQRLVLKCSQDTINNQELRKMKVWLSNENLSSGRHDDHDGLGTDHLSIPSRNARSLSLQRSANRSAPKKPLLTTSSLTQQLSTTHSGFVEVLFKSAPWTIYWCTVKDCTLRMYQSQEADEPLKSIALHGCTVQANSSQARKPHCLVLKHSASFPVYISTVDNLERQRWLQVLHNVASSSAVEEQQQLVNGGSLFEKESASSIESGSIKMSDSRSSALDQFGSSNSVTADSTLERRKQQVLKQFERNTKKTHKFSKHTTDSLKREKRGLVAMKKQISPHLQKLNDLAGTGNERAQEKIVALQMKIKQIDAVLPYLEKCITKNKEAELKTIAILQKKRDEELSKLEEDSKDNGGLLHPDGIDLHNSASDLYMRIISDNLQDDNDNSQMSELQSGDGGGVTEHSTPLHSNYATTLKQDEPDVTPIIADHSVLDGSLLDGTITPIVCASPIHRHNTECLNHNNYYNGDTAKTPVPMHQLSSSHVTQMHPIAINIDDVALCAEEKRIVPDNAATTAAQETSSAPTEMNTLISTNGPSAMPATVSQQNSITSASVPPPIRPKKKKKVPPPCPPRRSSCYIAPEPSALQASTDAEDAAKRSSVGGFRDAAESVQPSVLSSENAGDRNSQLFGADLRRVSVINKIKAFEKQTEI